MARMEKNTDELSEESFSFKEVTWKIPNFLDLPCTAGYYEESPEFRFANATWYLRLQTYGETSDEAGFVSLFLLRSQSSVPEHRIHCKIGLKTRRGKEDESAAFERTSHNDWGFLLLQWFKIMDRRQLLLPNGTLTVFCQIHAKEEAMPEASFRPPQHRNEPSQTEVQESVARTGLKDASSQTDVLGSVTHTEDEEASPSVQKLQLDYSKLLKSEEDSDVCLKVSDKEFRAHKCILRARSKVFSAMFKYETEEKASGEVVIDDLDPESFPYFLQHVYAGRVQGLSDENVFNLYSAADKYDLQELKWECREYMKRNLSVDTFCDVMIMAARHEEEELLKTATDYFSANFAEIFFTVNWQRFLTDHSTEANELLIKSFVPRKKK